MIDDYFPDPDSAFEDQFYLEDEPYEQEEALESCHECGALSQNLDEAGLCTYCSTPI